MKYYIRTGRSPCALGSVVDVTKSFAIVMYHVLALRSVLNESHFQSLCKSRLPLVKPVLHLSHREMSVLEYVLDRRKQTHPFKRSD